jgi:hypothetical protein
MIEDSTKEFVLYMDYYKFFKICKMTRFVIKDDRKKYFLISWIIVKIVLSENL